jgi:enoyl-CoA hydratase/carnithine racemase
MRLNVKDGKGIDDMEQMISAVCTERRGRALWLTLNRPHAMNSLNNAIVDGINTALDQAEIDRELRAVVLTGTGRAFCAGADLKSIQEMNTTGDPAMALTRFLERVRAMMRRLENFPLPTILGVNGLTLAGGLELLLCCDLVVADANATLGDGHGKFGLIPGGGASVRLPRRVGPSRAKYMMYTARSFAPSELLQWGLVNEVAPAGQLVSTIDALVASLADKSPLSLRRMKRLLDDSLEQSLDVALQAEITMSELHALSYDRNEGLAAFNEKRLPVFEGR